LSLSFFKISCHGALRFLKVSFVRLTFPGPKINCVSNLSKLVAYWNFRPGKVVVYWHFRKSFVYWVFKSPN
jgi:hypothetical protein